MRLIDADALDSVVMRLNKEENAQITRSQYKLIDRVIFEFPTIAIDSMPTMMTDRELLNWVKEIFDTQIIVWQDRSTGLYQPKDAKQDHYRKVYEFREKFLEAMRGRK